MRCLVAFELVFLNGLSRILAADLNAQTVQWSPISYGPDGPWQAVRISIGTPFQEVDLLPGGSWMSNVLAPTVCANGVACNVANEAGFYDVTSSNTSFWIGQTGELKNQRMGGTVGALSSLIGSATWWFDTVSIPMLNGIAGNSYNAIINNFDMLVISAANERLPDGTTYPAQIGKLGLGAPNFNQSWNHFPPNPRWNGTLLTSALVEQDMAPSNSYGMHVGSAAMGIPGSLNIGGYDQTRAIGPVSSQVYNIDHLPIDLLDIGIGVAEGASPFNFSAQSGLLAKGNSSLGLATTVFVEAPVPYIYLPQSTCDAITQYLPVTFQKKYGLYFWNTEDENYKRIVSSPAFLSFTFRLSGSLSQNLTINVPFALLNLTLTAPITSNPTQYLPLRPGLGPNGAYELGRAFLQAAFIGVNWQTAGGDGDGVWFLAQAPGPNTPSRTRATAIQPKSSTIVGSTDSWKDTWKGVWTVLATPSEVGGNENKSTQAVPTSTTSPDRRLSTGAIVGIGLAIGALLFVAVGLAVVFYRRSKRMKQQYAESAHMSYNGTSGPSELHGKVSSRPMELDTASANRSSKPYELAG